MPNCVCVLALGYLSFYHAIIFEYTARRMKGTAEQQKKCKSTNNSTQFRCCLAFECTRDEAKDTQIRWNGSEHCSVKKKEQYLVYKAERRGEEH